VAQGRHLLLQAHNLQLQLLGSVVALSSAFSAINCCSIV
jgi:hypothetical protein